MADLKAAAERLRGCDWTTPSQDKSDRLLAAQALEALAWMKESGWQLEYGVEDRWCCTNDVFTRYYADTPFGAILAAMEGERDDQI